MADKSIRDLNNAPSTVDDSNTLFVVDQNGTAYKLDGHAFILALTTVLDGHGGIKSITYTAPVSPSLDGTMVITLADNSTTSVTVKNGKGITSIAKTGTAGLVDTYTISFNDGTSSTFTVTNGAKGDTGDAWYVWIKYAGEEPTSDADMGDTPDNWIGIYSGTSSTAPTHYTDYDWFEIKGATGATGAAATVTDQSVTYQTSSSGTVAPSGSWTTTIPTVLQGDFLWTRTLISFNDGTVITAYSVSRYGIDGSGAVSTVNSVSPDGSGNVALTADVIPTSDNTSVQSHLTADESDISDLQNAVGDISALSGFAATDLVGAANELKVEITDVTEKKNAVFIGDSYVQANSLSPQSDRFSTRLCTLLNVNEYNYAIGGSDFLAPSGSTYLDQINSANSGMTATQKAKTKYVFICGGRNVPYNTPSYTFAQLNTAVGDCATAAHTDFPNATIVFIPMLWGSEVLNADYVLLQKQFDQILFENLIFNGFYIKNAFTWLQGYNDLILSDGVHPNVYGHKILATNIFNALNGNFHYKPLIYDEFTTNGVTVRYRCFDNIIEVAVGGTPSIALNFGDYVCQKNLGQHSGLVTRLSVNFCCGTRTGKAYPFQMNFAQNGSGDTVCNIQYLGNTVSANADTINGSVSMINGV